MSFGAVFKHKPSVKTLPKHFFAFDTETVGLYGKVVLICVVDQNGNEVYEDHGNHPDQAFIDWLHLNQRKLRGAVFYAHNMEFDISKLFGNAISNRNGKLLMSGSKFISFKYRINSLKEKVAYYITMRDSFNLIPSKLADIGEIFGYPKYKTPEKFITDDPDAHIEIDKEDIKYCYRDCKVIIESLKNLESMVAPFHTTIGYTAASTAKHIWQTAFLPETFNVKVSYDEEFRDAYYGGRTEVFISKHEHKSLYHYDINSMYPSNMIKPVPNPETFTEVTDYLPEDLPEILEKFEGYVKCNVTAPKDMNIPILPYRTDKLLFPSGTFTGSWCFPEIRLAIQNGYQINQIDRIVVALRMESPFKGYIEHFTDLKIKAGKEKNKPLRNFSKLMMNSLYGKFGERHEAEEIYEFGEDLENAPTDAQYKVIDSPDGTMLKRMNVPKVRADETVVAWAAYITSNARCDLWKYLNAGSRYCDTDSTFTDEKLPDELVDDFKLGMMALEDMSKESYFIDPKKYAYVTTEGEFKVTLKGIPKKVREAAIHEVGDMDKDTLVFEYDKPVKTKTALHRQVQPYSMEHQIKTLVRHGNPKRIFTDDGTSKPITIMEETI